jgi:Zn finger protein HypA/HybF involved in hydrogenase expression
MKVKLLKLKCKQCDWEWQPRKEDVRKCPRCQSVYWDKKQKGE